MLDDTMLLYGCECSPRYFSQVLPGLTCTVGFDHTVSRFHFERMVFSLVSYAGSIERPRDTQVKYFESSPVTVLLTSCRATKFANFHPLRRPS